MSVHHGSLLACQSGGSTRLCAQGLSSATAGNGQGKRHRNGRKRHRNSCLPGCGTEDFRDSLDIGTAVFPNAELKIFVTASAEIRAQRRYEELKAKGQDASFEEILHNVEERDRIDQSRAVSPLRKADDAILLDNSHLTIAEQKQWLKEQFEKAAHDHYRTERMAERTI